MAIFVTGKPGCGKSTLILEILARLRAAGKSVAGLLSPELRNGKRSGFELVDIATGQKALLAGIGIQGPKVSKYRVNISGIDAAVKLCRQSLDKADVIIIDEIGKMEMYSSEFRQLVEQLLKASRPVLATLHRAYAEQFKDKGQLIWLTRENFESVKQRLLQLLLEKSENFNEKNAQKFN